MSDVQEINDEFNLLADEVPANGAGSIHIEVEDIGEDFAVSFGHTNLSKMEVVDLLSRVLDHYLAEMGICICGECDEYIEEDDE